MNRGTAATLWRLWGFARPYRGILGASFACMVVLGITTGAYAYLLGPALRFLLSGGTEGLGWAARFFPQLAHADRQKALWLLPAAVVVIGVVKGAAYLGQFYGMGLFAQKVVADLRRTLFVKLSQLSPTRMSEQRTGDLLSRFSADVTAVEVAAMYTVASYVRDGLQIVILIGVALSLNWRFSLAMLVLLPIAAVPASRLTRSVLKRTREGQGKLGDLSAQVSEGLGGLRTLQAFNAQTAELSRFDAHAKVHTRAMVRAGWSRGAVPGVMEVLAALAIACALSWAAATHAIPPEQLLSILTAVVLLYQPAKDIGRVSQFAIQAAVAGERLFEILDAPSPVVDPPGARSAPTLSKRVTLEGVSFAYGERPALDGLELEIPVGQVTALVGGSGGGKSTVTRLLLRFERPSSGRILLDGEDVAGLTTDSVRAQFALVTQEPLLFSTTVRENLLYARPDATEQELIAAAQVANADGFIRALPKGYDTPIGERGVVLSGGQKQRLCLARAVLARAPVLVLDEATSNLDPQSEREVQEALTTVLQGRTALVIAHRLSTIVRADRIVVMEAGRAVESGTHAELLARGGRYARLWALQGPQGQPQVGAA